MKFLFATDSFKGSLSSAQMAKILAETAGDIFPGCTVKGVSVADGGEGTVDAVLEAAGGERVELDVHGPRMEPVRAYYGKLPGDRAVLEMAAASGLPMVPVPERNPFYTTTYGTGELIVHAMEQGCRDITIAIGGSATNDGGMGAMKALGVRFLDQNGVELAGTGENLEKVETICLEGLHPLAAECRFTVMCDVNNPLTGPDGATFTFGKQKGGTPEILEILEKGMKHYEQKLTAVFGREIGALPGAGAAGGLGAALCGFLNGQMKSGIEAVLDLIDFDTLLDGVDLVVTGEGRMDWQSAFGKVPSGVGMRAKKKGIPAAAIVGGMGRGCEKLYEYGIGSILTTVNGPMELDEAMSRAEELYRDAAVRMFRFLKMGIAMEMKQDGSIPAGTKKAADERK